MIDPVLDTLMLPFEDGLVDLPADGGLFLRARFGQALSGLPRESLVCEQSFKPAYDVLARAGFTVRADDDGSQHALTLVLPPRQREEYRALLARAVTSTRDGGIVMAAVSNLEGAKTVENDLKALTGNVDSLSKNKCRVFWARIDDRRNAGLIGEWLALDAPRAIEGGRFTSRPGLFAWDRLDAGSKLLVDNLPDTLKGKMADLGAGFGYLSDEILKRYPLVSHLDVVEAEKRALDVARINLASYAERVALHWCDATKTLPDSYDAIISNPPFHIDRADRHDLGKAFIVSAAKALTSGGQLWMVANRHLPYEETLKGAFKNVAIIADNNYFKVFKAIGPKGATKA